jgi:selenocysteine lyase/cysteine desulfurase
MAMPPARDRVHDHRAPAARPDRPASRPLVRRRAPLGHLLRNPLRLASDTRRFDVSPAWPSWHAAAATLELFDAVELGRIHEHNLALANRLRTGLGLEPGDSAIVSLDAADETTERLAAAGVKAAVRANRIRLSCHLYNDEEDVDRTLEVLTDLIHPGDGSPSARSGKAHA